MKTKDLVLRCYGKKDGDQWIAACIDIDLVAQADTFEEARIKLNEQIKSYVYDALVGEDKEYASQLLRRKAPLIDRIRFNLNYFQYKCLSIPHRVYKTFRESLPLQPA